MPRNLPVTPTLLLFRGAAVIMLARSLDDSLSVKETKCAHAISQTLAPRKSCAVPTCSESWVSAIVPFLLGRRDISARFIFLFVDGNFFLLSLV
jgi:hypothetical protein